MQSAVRSPSRPRRVAPLAPCSELERFSGHLDGLRRAWAAHAPELFGYAKYAFRDAAAADEAVQDTFLRAWRAAAQFDRSRPLPQPWLFAILRNVIIDSARSRYRRGHLATIDDDRVSERRTDTVNEQDLDVMFDRWILSVALDRLGADHRTVLVEAFFRGRPYTEIAHDLDIPVGTVRSRSFYALRALRLVLEELGWES